MCYTQEVKQTRERNKTKERLTETIIICRWFPLVFCYFSREETILNLDEITESLRA